MSQYKTPGVYVKEKSAFGLSIGLDSTAVPVFIGYTQKNNGEIIAVNNLSEFTEMFGGPLLVSGTYAENDSSFKMNQDYSSKHSQLLPKFFLYYAIEHYFSNGGGKCYIASINEQKVPLPEDDINTAVINKDHFNKVLEKLDTLEEATLVLAPEAIQLAPLATDTAGSWDDYKGVCSKLLQEGHDSAGRNGTRSRLAVLDAMPEESATGSISFTNFEAAISQNEHRSYGTAYYPFLKTNIPLALDESKVEVTDTHTLSIVENNSHASHLETETLISSTDPVYLDSLKTTNPAKYAKIRQSLGQQVRIVLPPSAAVVGVYARTDASRGVWKAPANTPLLDVSEPVRVVTDSAQEKLNAPNSGKAINVIRSFTGKGILVWGARTLNADSLDWRYINVRRLFLAVEDTCRSAAHQFVFEPNDQVTWLKVKAMIDSLLNKMWKQGALVGLTQDEAYQISIGLGSTMTGNDILEGMMKITVKMAPSRPAEFIEFTFTQMMQTS
ncbi:phage tail sheath family protein [Endozoicomonas sp. SM1973]|uniref:Phage tail sheath family protein n=1 Tax=Spartinivicinus marinus TaxID=2994442 RepID=A0A853I305_9GAMM|nr:phage tail sheath C-terminal domain-containing protein [Spartinivicinus marinus]MCX4029640.1 phage tail sheath subtilisin-like domain-containing protein [Spartinivicinus marinus]NYZ66979.1 phage tail sheath family protein [Spartinivicinus marinus]